MSVTTTSKPILVGEANPYGSDPRYALYPEPEYSAGGRLCHLIMGLEKREYIRRFIRLNLCIGKWGSKEAEHSANVILSTLSDHILILLGSKVCRAFSTPFEPFVLRTLNCHVKAIILPHPSGLCRIWHEPDAVNRARRTLHTAGIDFVAPAI